jgi:hypothetical protein
MKRSLQPSCSQRFDLMPNFGNVLDKQSIKSKKTRVYQTIRSDASLRVEAALPARHSCVPFIVFYCHAGMIVDKMLALNNSSAASCRSREEHAGTFGSFWPKQVALAKLFRRIAGGGVGGRTVCVALV